MSAVSPPPGPLHGIRVVELAGLGPSQHGAMLLADLGADIIRVDRPVAAPDRGRARDRARRELLNRGRRSNALDLKDAGDLATARALIDRADVVIDPYRPGVAERLGLDPEGALGRNPRLVFARMTGWGQDGPLAPKAGHDITYLAAAGLLEAIGPADRPPPVPLNVIGDFGGGGMLLAFGIVAALLERERSGRGQVLDVAMVDGVASLMSGILNHVALGEWRYRRGANFLQSAPWYRAYETADGRFVTVGTLEEKFYAGLLERLGLDVAEWPQWDESRWPALSERLAGIFATRTAAEWDAAMADADICFAVAVPLDEAPAQPHLAARGAYVERDGVVQPAPVPRFGRTPGAITLPPPWPGEHAEEILRELGDA
jgi:alpha-methylacyl-CoA racemase